MVSLGCGTPSGPGAKALPGKYGQPYEGLRAAVPDLLDGGRRLDLFIGVPVEVPEGEEVLDAQPSFSVIVYCVALNEGKDPLTEVSKLVVQTPADRPIYIWGEAIKEKRGFWWDGVTCIAKALAVWHPKARVYVYYDLAYETPWWRWKTIKSGLKTAVEGGKRMKGLVP